MKRFSNFIDDNELIGMPLVGRRFTWTNNQEMAVISRIDWFLIFDEWEDHFLIMNQVELPR